MTSICPRSFPKTCQPLFANMADLTAHWSTLAPAHCRLAILNLGLLHPLIEQADALELLTTLLSPAELEIFRRFSYPKRRLEWLGGRLAAKHCLHQVVNGHVSGQFRASHFSILPDANGRPRLEQPLPDFPSLSVSISHSRGYAAALACQAGACGIDIQQTTPQLASVQERFASAEELDLIDPMVEPLTRLGLLWTAKEAVKKCLLADHPSFFGAIRLTEVQYLPDEAIWTARCRLTDPAAMSARVRIGQHAGHLVACAWGESHA